MKDLPLCAVSIIAALVAFLLVMSVLLSVSACAVAPRSATMCVKNGDWVKCPANTPAGTILKDKK